MYTLSPLANDFDFARSSNFQVYYTITNDNVEKMIYPEKADDIIYAPNYKGTTDYLENLLRLCTQKVHIENNSIEIDLRAAIKNSRYFRNLNGSVIGIKVVWFTPDYQSWDTVFDNYCKVNDVIYDFDPNNNTSEVMKLKVSVTK